MNLPFGIGTYVVAIFTSASLILQPASSFFSWPTVPTPSSSQSLAVGTAIPPPSIRQMLDVPAPRQVTFIMHPPSSYARVSQLTNLFATDVLASLPAFGTY